MIVVLSSMAASLPQAARTPGGPRRLTSRRRTLPPTRSCQKSRGSRVRSCNDSVYLHFSRTMDIDLLEFLTTPDQTTVLSTAEVMAEMDQHLAYLTLAVARDGLDLVCERHGLLGSPKISRHGCNHKAPMKDCPFRWKTPQEFQENRPQGCLLYTSPSPRD